MGAQRTVAENLSEVRERIARAAERAGRSASSIRLVAVSKQQPVEAIREAIAAGATEIGENYVQEAESKLRSLGETRVIRHFIGHLQRNKAARAAALFDVVQTVDSAQLASALSRQGVDRGHPLEVLLEVNISGEPAKFGVDPGDLPQLVGRLAELPGLRLCGLMGMGPLHADEQRISGSFEQLRKLFEALPAEYRHVLSMGMTGDYEQAIIAGSTLVRIGTGIFGPRRQAV
jgi:pyridoxal phosphate enzyme (YggS family)